MMQLDWEMQVLQRPWRWSIVAQQYFNIQVAMENPFEMVQQAMVIKKKELQYTFDGPEDITKLTFNSQKTIAFYQQFLLMLEAKKVKELNNFIKSIYPELIPGETQSQNNTVCAKLVKAGDTIVQCFQCRVDGSCIICMDCYKNGDHKGHKVLFKKAYGGCCDCGDPEAWKPSGFCKIHSGQALDVDIPAHIASSFVNNMQDLYYIYCYFKMNSKKPDMMRKGTFFFHILLQFMESTVSKGLKGIKLITLFLTSKMPLNLRYNKKIQEQMVLYQLLRYDLVGVDMRKWQNLFIQMFPYYQFKKQLMAAYVNCIPRLHNNEISSGIGQSISCQILTSYKLVEDYVFLKSNKPLGFGLNQKDYSTDEFQNIYYNIFGDLGKICNLQGTVPQEYVIFHFAEPNGLQCIFGFQDVILNLLDSQQKKLNNKNKKKDRKKKIKRRHQALSNLQEEDDEQNELLNSNVLYFVIRNIKYIQLQYHALLIFNNLVQKVSKNQPILLQILKQCLNSIRQQQNSLIIFRPYERAFSIIMFYLCSGRLESIDHVFVLRMREALNIDQKEWNGLLQDIQGRMLQCYLFYTHIITNESRGYHSSFYTYLYFYRIKDRFLPSVDIVGLKIMSFLKKASKYQFNSLIRLQDYEPAKWNSHILKIFLQEINLLYLGNFPEIGMSHINSNCHFAKIYQQDILKYLSKFITSQGGSVTLQRAHLFAKAYMFENNDLLKDYLKMCCTFNKEKKIFELKQGFKDEVSINYIDFQLRGGCDNFQNKVQTGQSLRTLQLVTQNNKRVFNNFWTFQNLQTIKTVILSVYQDLKENQPTNVVQYLKSILKFVTIVKAVGNQEQGLFVEEILLHLQLKEYIKQCQEFRSLLGMDNEGQEQGKGMVQQKKELMKMKKNKKLQQLKKRKTQNMIRIKEMHNEMGDQQDQHEDYCVICRRKDNPKHQLVYITKIFFRDYESFFEKGNGVVSPFFRTCYHVFDFQCIKESTIKKSASEWFRCPICRKVGNFYVPAYPLENVQKNKLLVEGCRDYLTNLSIMLKNYESVCIQDQILKSFYNLAIVFSYEPSTVQKHHLKIYRTLFQLLLTPTFSGQIDKLILKFKKHAINLKPKALNKKRKKNLNLLKASLQNEDEYQIDSSDEEGLQFFIDLIRQQQQDLKYDFKKLSEKKEQKTNQHEIKKMKKVEYSTEFIYVCLRVLHELKKQTKSSGNQLKPVEKEHMNNNKSVSQEEQAEQFLEQSIMPEVSMEIQYVTDLITNNQSSIEPQSFQKSKFQLIKLPPFYNWDMNQNKCENCREPCFDMMLCLVCGWKGCLNCKGGGIQKHYKKKHGGICAAIRLKDGKCYMMGQEELKLLGCLYKNEWGEQFNIKRNWQQYVLQSEVAQTAIEFLIRNS